MVADLDARMVVAYMMGEGTLGDTRGASLVGAAYQAVLAP